MTLSLFSDKLPILKKIAIVLIFNRHSVIQFIVTNYVPVFLDGSTIDREITRRSSFLHETMGEFNQPNTRSARKACKVRSNFRVTSREICWEISVIFFIVFSRLNRTLKRVLIPLSDLTADLFQRKMEINFFNCPYRDWII